MYEVAKAFTTTNRRFTPGMAVTPDDVAGDKDWDHLVDRGFVVEVSTAAKPARAPAWAADPPAA